MLEVFRNLRNLKVSNLGNVMYNNELVEQKQGEYYKYIYVNGEQLRVHVLVAEAFPDICGIKKEGYHVHHINEDQLDNRAENLICLSPSEHKSLHQEQDGVSVPIVVYDKEGNKVGEYPSCTYAAAALGCDYRHVSDIVHHRGRRFTHKGYYFFKKDEEPEDIKVAMGWIDNTKYNTIKRPKAPKVEKKAKQNARIIMTDMNGFQVQTFENINSAVDFFGKTRQAVKKSIETATKIRYNGVWYKLTEKNI